MKPVAETRAQKGGPCDDCGMPIGVGNRIYKYPAKGRTTRPGNGPGRWVCSWCHEKRQAALRQRFTCVSCGVEENVVVEFAGKIVCPDCYASICVEAGKLL